MKNISKLNNSIKK